MEKMREAGLQTQEQLASVEEKERESGQFALTEDGDVVEVDSGLSEEGEQPEGEESQAEGQPKYYTPEEISELGLEKLDPNRLHPELVPFYKSMQADYTRKTQALAEERRAIERVLDKALSHPELAKEFMNDPELISLAQKHPELAQKLQAVSRVAQSQDVNPIKRLTEMAKKAVEQELGEEFDEFNPEHMTALALKVLEIRQQYARQQAIQQKLAELQASEPHFAEIDRYAKEKLAQMPYAEAVKIEQALKNGDIEAVLSFWEQCRKEWYQKNLNPQPSQPAPPPVEGAGKGEVEVSVRPDPSSIAGMDDDEIAQWLIKNGFVN